MKARVAHRRRHGRRLARHHGRPWAPQPGPGLVATVNVTIDVLDARTGRLRRQEGHNRVVTAGRSLLRDLLAGGAGLGLTEFRLGADNAPVSSANTALGLELLAEPITLLDSSQPAQLVAYYYLGTSALDGSTIREAGLFNAAGTMYARFVLDTEIEKDTSTAVVFTWTLNWTASGMSINIESGHTVDMGGTGSLFQRPASPNAYPAGSTLDKAAPESWVWYLDSADLPEDSEFVLEAVLLIESAGAVPKIAAFNLDDGSPDTPLTGSEVAGGGSTTGEVVRSSTITFPGGGDPKRLVVKVTTDNIGKGVAARSIRFVRIA